jgi:hypothetical protein
MKDLIVVMLDAVLRSGEARAKKKTLDTNFGDTPITIALPRALPASRVHARYYACVRPL